MYFTTYILFFKIYSHIGHNAASMFSFFMKTRDKKVVEMTFM